MCKSLAFSQRQSLSRRLESTWEGFIIDGLAARSRGCGREGEIADGDAL